MKVTTPHDPATEELLRILEGRRVAAGMTLSRLAELSGVGYQYVHGLLRAIDNESRRHSPTIDKLAPIARALGYRLKLVRDRR